MLVDIAIPTLNRKDRLNKCISSILKASKTDNIKLNIYFSDPFEMQYYKPYFVQCENVILKMVDWYRVPNFWNSCLKNSEADVLCYLNDDIEVHDGFFEALEQAFKSNYPDYDGVIGIKQDNLVKQNVETLQGAFGAIGLKYADRFPNRQIWCTDYNRFYADKELQLYAESINKFFYCEEAKIDHWHGSFYGEDETHKKVRLHLQEDKRTFNQRQTMGLLWGKTYDTVKKI